MGVVEGIKDRCFWGGILWAGRSGASGKKENDGKNRGR